MSDEHELAKSKVFIVVEIIEYQSNSVVIKTILKKSTGSISALSFDMGERFSESTSPFDTFLLVIEGQAEVIIDGNSNILSTGQSITIPALARNQIVAHERFKMISTVIKSGYEDIAL
jgi:quercetin dioxygenase-like cupin family protein